MYDSSTHSGGQLTTTLSSIEAAKKRARNTVTDLAADLERISREIHAHPELGFNEHHACQTIVPYVRSQGFDVQERVYGLETAFRAERGHGPVTIAICAEYDALPEIGHACGHNLIAAAGIGAAVAAAAALDPSQARIVLLGTPAEEGGGGKIHMIEGGCFDDIDAALMAHPGAADFVYALIQGGARVEVQYFGKAAHQGGAPERGVNALDGIVTAYNGVSQLRQHIRGDARLGAIITQGGDAVNVIPDHAAGIFSARAGTSSYLAELKQRLEACLEAGAKATGCRVEMRWSEREYAPFRHNHAMADAYIANGNAIGKSYIDLSRYPVGGTDMANVSHIVPSIHPEFAIGAPPSIQNHTRDFTDLACTDAAHAAMLDAAYLLAITTIELVLDRNLLACVKEEFDAETRTKV